MNSREVSRRMRCHRPQNRPPRSPGSSTSADLRSCVRLRHPAHSGALRGVQRRVAGSRESPDSRAMVDPTQERIRSPQIASTQVRAGDSSLLSEFCTRNQKDPDHSSPQLGRGLSTCRARGGVVSCASSWSTVRAAGDAVRYRTMPLRCRYDQAYIGFVLVTIGRSIGSTVRSGLSFGYRTSSSSKRSGCAAFCSLSK